MRPSLVGIIAGLMICAASAFGQTNDDSLREAQLDNAERQYQFGEIDSALRSFQAYIEAFPGTPHAIMRLGECYVIAEKYDSAALYLKAAIGNGSVDSGGPSLHTDLGWAYFKMRDFPRAIEEYKTRLAESPDDSEARGHLGQVYIEMADYVNAVAELERACQHRDSDSLRCRDLEIAVSNWCVELSKKNDYDSIETLVTREINRGYLFADLYYWRGEALLHHDSAGAAVPAYVQATELRPTDPFSFLGLGHAYQTLGMFKVAADDGYSRAVALDPSSAFAYAGLGYCRLQAKQYALAVEALEKALQLNPADNSSKYNAVLSYLELQNTDKACAHWRDLKSSAPDLANELASRITCK